jgi:hypothetical protein
VAQLGRLVQGLRESGERYEGLFKQYDETTRSSLQKDHFDTVYYDVIQGVDIRELLKPVLDEVEIVLQSFSLVSAELSDIRCVDLYEGSIRFQLFLQYFLLKESFSDEELWSVLFDVYNQVMEIRESFVEYSPEELAELQEKIKYLRNN